MHPIDKLEHVLGTSGPSAITRRHVEALRGAPSTAIEFAAVRWWHWLNTGDDLLRILPISDEMQASVMKYFYPLGRDEVKGLLRPMWTETWSIHPIPTSTAGWDPGTGYLRFESRFKRLLLENGLSEPFALRIVASFSEMAANAAEHSLSPVAPVACFQVGSKGWEFSVTDVGCGMLGSIRRNRLYATVQHDVDALKLALCDGVSCTGDKMRGRGFSTLFKALVDRNCVLRFRSSESAAHWSGHGPSMQSLSLTVLPRRIGFHVCVSAPWPVRRP